jgi:hypothetical protein
MRGCCGEFYGPSEKNLRCMQPPGHDGEHGPQKKLTEEDIENVVSSLRDDLRRAKEVTISANHPVRFLYGNNHADFGRPVKAIHENPKTITFAIYFPPEKP